MDDLLLEALSNFKLHDPYVELIRHNENATYKIIDKETEKEYVLRIHKTSDDFSLDVFGTQTHSLSLINDEMRFIQALEENTDIAVQRPLVDKEGRLVTVLQNDIPATLLKWINGKTVEESEITNDILFNIGLMTAKLHNFSENWTKQHPISRYSYDIILVNNVLKKIENGYLSGIINCTQFELIQKTVAGILSCMQTLDQKPNSKGIVHSDLSKSNMIIADNAIVPIDFCLCGHSYFYMDLGSLFSHFDEDIQRKIILDGYMSFRNEEINYRYIEAFFVLQILLFIATHLDSVHKQDWFTEALNRWCRDYFKPFGSNQAFLKN